MFVIKQHASELLYVVIVLMELYEKNTDFLQIVAWSEACD